MSTLYIVLAVAVVLLIALIVVYLLQQKKKKKARAAQADEPVGPGGDEISLLIAEANNKLAAAKAEPNARVGNLPVYILLGETGSAKTSVMLHSGLDPELLAGQVLPEQQCSSHAHRQHLVLAPEVRVRGSRR